MLSGRICLPPLDSNYPIAAHELGSVLIPFTVANLESIMRKHRGSGLSRKELERAKDIARLRGEDLIKEIAMELSRRE